KLFAVAFFLSVTFFTKSQDSLYARLIIKKLTSKECYGRGYLNNGLDVAAKFITDQLKRFKAKPLFSTGYYQWFDFDVNTFPNNVGVKLNSKVIKPGNDFILNPQSGSIKGKFNLKQIDSVTYKAIDSPIPVILSLKRKLTFSVATNSLAGCEVELLNKNQYKDFKTLDVNIESKVLTKFINKNICAYIEGTKNNDTCIYFTAHYDHLGGLGKKTFFPGANDNASGVSALLNFIKYYSEHPPKYKTVFVFFAGEEAGLLGSKHFVEKGGIDLKSIKFLINLDLLGTGDDGIMVTNGAVLTSQFETLTKINAQRNYVKEIKKRGKAQNSDHYWFTEKGVPAFFIYTLGGIKAYHDVDDVEKTLPLTDYGDVFRLLRDFVNEL
ncbi:MAG TPA: M28 family metallopeptidase, partial [Bacteroidia bacterium]|nr:M28 family metallopeptidase [Bacteroidia bacterium]